MPQGFCRIIFEHSAQAILRWDRIHEAPLSDAASDELDTSEGSAAMDTERNILSTETAGITTATAAHIPTAAAMREINR